jgi:hypothetical protein
MTRSTWPVLAIMVAMIVLFAGAFAHLPNWRRECPANVAPAYEPTTANPLRPPASCGCCSGAGGISLSRDAVAPKSFPARRPWMIGH